MPLPDPSPADIVEADYLIHVAASAATDEARAMARVTVQDRVRRLRGSE